MWDVAKKHFSRQHKSGYWLIYDASANNRHPSSDDNATENETVSRLVRGEAGQNSGVVWSRLESSGFV